MDNSDRFDHIPGEDLRQFCGISVNVRIQFRAQDYHDPIPQEFGVKTCVREGDTISSDEQIGVIKIRGCCVEQFELNRPLSKL